MLEDFELSPGHSRNKQTLDFGLNGQISLDNKYEIAIILSLFYLLKNRDRTARRREKRINGTVFIKKSSSKLADRDSIFMG